MRRSTCVATLNLLCLAMATLMLPVDGSHAARAQEAAAAKSVSQQVDLDRIFQGGVPRSLVELKAMEARQQALAGKVIPATVGVRRGQIQGSGVIISEDGYILTAAHVAQRPGMEMEILLHNGEKVFAETLGLNRTLDAGLMKIRPSGDEGEALKWPHVEFGRADQLKQGQWCMVTGHPGGYQADRQPVVRFGRVLHYSQSEIQTDCTLVGGDSGGPLFDMQGKVIGIHSRIGGSLTTNLHVPISAYQQTWDRLVAGEMWGEVPSGAPYIGVRGDSESDVARVAVVEPGMPAHQAGIRPGDIILKFDGETITDFESLVLEVSNKRPGERIKVVVRRGEQMLELDLVVGRKRN